MEVSGFGPYMQTIADVDFARGLRFMPIGDDAAQFAGPGCECARFEEARRPKPFVHSDAIHGSIVLQPRRSLHSPGRKRSTRNRIRRYGDGITNPKPSTLREPPLYENRFASQKEGLQSCG
jgi:hypothetical protein